MMLGINIGVSKLGPEWASVLQSLSLTLIKTHLKLIKLLLGILETSKQVCCGKLELNSAGPSLDTTALTQHKNYPRLKNKNNKYDPTASSQCFGKKTKQKKNTILQSVPYV